ncbi:uncharacterized protein LOC111050932 isoform X3 [Nilaparvata lugens]|uniref:uncharacterized protein LOC111050932 isoform X3 n=1 Tax=Nilaparvata lugens TaxID=108931 RepID=UPI00193D72E3|nr:uncharacterized protein LOC111050932 isoform X3 [Nilaparvata lugens]
MLRITLIQYFMVDLNLMNHLRMFTYILFKGLVILPSDDLREKFIDDKGNFRNQLHDEILQFSAKSRESGYTYQVETEFNFRIDNRGGEIVTCVKNDDKDTQRTSWMKTKIRVNKKSTSFISIWPLVDRKTEKKHILHDSYEMWSCKNQEFEFYRIVNKMLMKENTRVYYHPDGVEVQRLILLDGQKFIQIKNERFLREREEKREAIEYIGRLQLERQTLPGFEKMLSSPPFNIQVLGKEAEELSPYQPSYIFTLDSMRYAAFLGLGQRSADKDQPPPIVFSDEMDALQTESFNAKSSRIFQLGRFWNKLLIPKKTMKCYVYTTANLRAMGYRTYPEDDKTKYNPRVAEYIDQKLHILTQDEFDKIFTITSVRTWFCTDNTDEFIKVETVFETTTIPSSVRFADGVKVKLENVKNKELLKITETVYVDMMNSNVYKRLQREPEEPEGKKKKEKQDDLMEFVIKSEKKSGWHIHIPFL